MDQRCKVHLHLAQWHPNHRLTETSDCIDIAYKALFDSSRRRQMLFVDQEAIPEPVRDERSDDSSTFDKRWLGGTMTNFQTIKRSIRIFRSLQEGKGRTIAVLPEEGQSSTPQERPPGKNPGGIRNEDLRRRSSSTTRAKETQSIHNPQNSRFRFSGSVDTNCDPTISTTTSRPTTTPSLRQVIDSKNATHRRSPRR